MAQMVRDWRFRLLGGMGMSLVVPGMLFVSLAVLAFAGGFGGLAALGQAFSGPPAPTAALTGVRAGGAPQPLPEKLIAALSAAPRSPAASGPIGGGGAAGQANLAPTGASGPGAPGGPPAGGSPPAQTIAAPRRPGPAPAPPTPPSTHPQPTVVDQLVGEGSSVTGQLPGPVGPTATSALRTAGTTLNSIAPIKAR